MRHATISWLPMVIAAALLFPTVAGGEDSPKAPQTGLVVHEWGVAIRQSTQSGTLLSSPAELVSGLPSFVVRQKDSGRKFEPQGWDKPVLWFYGATGTKISVDVSAEQGFATACFPAAQVLTRRFSHVDRKAMMMSLITESAGFHWDGTLTDEPNNELSKVDKAHWWSAARSGGGLYFNAKGASERFLFYEASAFQEPTVTAELSSDAITIRNSHEMASSKLVLLVNDGDKHYGRLLDAIEANAAVTLRRDEVMKQPGTPEDLLAACSRQWESCGLSAAEANTVVAIWRADLLKPGRMLLISRMPPKLYDAMFPLKISPEPNAIVRVGMVFDPLEIASWSADTREKLASLGQQLSSERFADREAATAELTRMGSGARGLLEALLKSNDVEVRTRAADILAKITPAATKPARLGPEPGGATVVPVR